MIHLPYFLAQHPHAGRLRRRRDRHLGAVRFSRPNAFRYASVLRVGVVDQLRAAGLEVARALRPHWPRAHDAAPPTIRHEVGKVRARVEPKIKGAAPAVAKKFVTANVHHVDEKLSNRISASMGVQVRQAFLMDQSAIAETMSDSLHENIQLISSIPEDYFDELEQVLGENWVNEGDWRQAVDEVADLGDVTQSRAELIARDQTMKMNSRFNEARQTSMGVTSYEWVTVGDDRVRDAHVEMEGEIFDWDNPPTDSDGDTGHPGDCGVNCRCAADPVLDVDAEPDEETPGDEEEVDEGD